MKYCENCGAKLNDDDIFCENCGAKQSEISTPIKEPQSEQILVNNNIQKKKKLNIKIIIPVVVVCIAAIAAFIVYNQNSKKVNINDYISVNFSGYNTVGEAHFKIDKEGLNKAILKAQGKKESEILSDDSLSSYEALHDCVRISLSNRSGLSNGDKIELKLEYDEAANDLLGIKLVYSNKEYTVEGLQEAKKIDAFEDIAVTFSGVSPNGKASVKNNSDDSYIKNLKYELSKTSGIKIGDKVTVKVNVDTQEALKQGYIIEETTKEYTCEKLDTYISKLEDLQEAQIEKLKKEAQDKMESYGAQKNAMISSMRYLGAYTLVSKGKNDNGYNRLYLLYLCDITYKKSSSSQEQITENGYIPILIPGVMLKADGSVQYDSCQSVTGNTYIGSVSCYKSGTDMYSSLITKKKDLYTYTVSGGVSEFGN